MTLQVPGEAGTGLVSGATPAVTPTHGFILPSICGDVLADELWSTSRMFSELLAIMS